MRPEAGIKLYAGVTGRADAAAKALAAGSLEYDPDARCDHHDHHHGEGHDCHSHECGKHSLLMAPDRNIVTKKIILNAVWPGNEKTDRIVMPEKGKQSRTADVLPEMNHRQ